MNELHNLHRRLVNALLAVSVVTLPFVANYWPDRVPPVAAWAICLAFLGAIVAHETGRINTPRATQVLVVSLGALSLGGSVLQLLRHPDPAVAFAGETYNQARAMALLTGGAYVTLGRRQGRRAAIAALGIWIVATLTLIEQLGLLEMTSAAVLVPMLDVVVTTFLAGVLFDVAAINARHLERSRRSARRLAQIDALTNVNNRHGVLPAMHRALDNPGDAALIVLDLDHFKRINDTHGHSGGDEILRQVGRALTAACRDGDAVGRWGGEEFVVVLQAGGRDAADRVARKIRGAIHDLRADFPVSASFGVTLVESSDSVETLFKRADDALYEAKRNGRDRIVTTWQEGDVVDLTTGGERRTRQVNREALLEASRERLRRN